MTNCRHRDASPGTGSALIIGASLLGTRAYFGTDLIPHSVFVSPTALPEPRLYHSTAHTTITAPTMDSRPSRSP